MTETDKWFEDISHGSKVVEHVVGAIMFRWNSVEAVAYRLFSFLSGLPENANLHIFYSLNNNTRMETLARLAASHPDKSAKGLIDTFIKCYGTASGNRNLVAHCHPFMTGGSGASVMVVKQRSKDKEWTYYKLKTDDLRVEADRIKGLGHYGNRIWAYLHAKPINGGGDRALATDALRGFVESVMPLPEITEEPVNLLQRPDNGSLMCP